MKLTDKVKRDWFLDKLLNLGYYIEFWDLSALIFPNKDENNIVDGVRIRELKNFRDLYELLNNYDNRKALYVVIIPLYYEALKVYRLLKKTSIFSIFFLWGEAPSLTRNKNIINKIRSYSLLHKNKISTFKQFYKRLITKINIKLNLPKRHDICFFAGDVCRKYATGKNNYGINLCDYDQILTDDSERTITGDYAVFLDINRAHNIDVDIGNLLRINSKEYIEQLNAFFKRFEKYYKLDVVIASHPTSKYSKDTFDSRKIIPMKTSNLVKFSKHVLLHHSTALSYAIIYKKPITFFVTKEMSNHYDHHISRLLSNYLSRQLIVLNENYSFESIPIYERLYDKYKYNYIVSKETESVASFDLVQQKINNYFKDNFE